MITVTAEKISRSGKKNSLPCCKLPPGWTEKDVRQLNYAVKRIDEIIQEQMELLNRLTIKMAKIKSKSDLNDISNEKLIMKALEKVLNETKENEPIKKELKKRSK